MAETDNLVSLITPGTRLKVSSTLDKSVGKKFLTDGSPETCWTSQQGLPQSIQILFDAPVIPLQISITFQGGFVGTRCSVDFKSSDSSDWQTLTRIYPEDVNRKQLFDLNKIEAQEIAMGVHSLKLVFEESSDFFGRIIVYDLDIRGRYR